MDEENYMAMEGNKKGEEYLDLTTQEGRDKYNRRDRKSTDKKEEKKDDDNKKEKKPLTNEERKERRERVKEGIRETFGFLGEIGSNANDYWDDQLTRDERRKREEDKKRK